jgi:cyclic 2,3-diphosphoglycerate synthase
VDGEHYPPVTLDAVEELSAANGWDPVALFFLGGTEKVSSDRDLDLAGKPVIFAKDLPADLAAALRTYRPEVVVDLSDEPVVDNRLRFQLISHTLHAGAHYRGADFEFHPPALEAVLEKPSISVMGAGKRCGKTAVSAHLARHLKGRSIPCAVIAMGRGGPPEPELLCPPSEGIDCGFLLEQLEQGRHAASDYFEDALIAGVTTIGCRRCGGGMAGAPFVTNFTEGAVLANRLEEQVIILEGSGAAIPPVRADLNLYVINAGRPLEEALGYLGLYRLLISDAVVITMCEESDADMFSRLEEGIGSVRDDIAPIRTIFRPFPLKSIENKVVFFTCTAPARMRETLVEHLETTAGCKVVGWSNNLADRRLLEAELDKAPDFEVLLTELKAAAVDVAARFASETGKETVFVHNRPIATGEESIEAYFDGLIGRLGR